MIRFRVVLLTLFVCVSAAFAAASTDALRFTASPGVVQMRVQVLWPAGTTLYDSDWKSGNLLEWSASTLPYGSYAVRISTRDLDGRALERLATLHVAPEGISLGASTDLKLTTTVHDGETGQIVTTSGDLSFRFGDFLNRKDTEAMRLTAQGDLDVAGFIRAGKGIVFPDGSIQRSAAMPSIMRQAGALHPIPNISGAGTTNRVTKWLDGSGTVGDSAITEIGGKVGIGTNNPGGQLHIYGASNLDLFAGMGPDVISGPGFNFGYAGNSFGIGAGFFNVRPAPGAVGVNPSLRFMTVDAERMIVTNSGNVGIGTSSPLAKFHVQGSQPPAASVGNGVDAARVLQIIGAKGGDTSGAIGGTGSDILIQAGDGGNSANFSQGGYGGSLILRSGRAGAGFMSYSQYGAIRLEPGPPYGQVILAPGGGNVRVGYSNPYFDYFLSVIPNGCPPYICGENGIRVETAAAGGTLASFGGLGVFEIDAPGVHGGRVEVTEAGNVGIGVNAPQQMLSVRDGMNIDQGNTNNGTVSVSTLTFGSASGEGIASKRTAGGNQFGLDFYTASTNRMSIANAGGVTISGDLNVVGTLSKGAGSFKIDHPLDPENKYLYHSFVESPDMKNIYDGVVGLDGHGEATVELPEWFEALNGDFRYQLTAIGKPSPGLYVAEEVINNRFKIAGGTAGARVSWMVTGIRHDTYANVHRIPVEEIKPDAERGTVLH